MMRTLALLLLLVLSTAGCSMRRFAMNRVADSLASGGSTFENDDDLKLIGDAMPFGLKMYETFLAETPNHKGLLLAACQGFASYSYVYVQSEADRVEEDDLERAKSIRARARRLYQRALGYCTRSLDVAYPGLSAKLLSDPTAAVALVRKKSDVPQLYWTSVSLGLAISVSKNDTNMLARIPEAQALIDRALALDESWKNGALHEFQVTFAGAKPGATDYDAVTKHYQRCLNLSQGRRAGVHVAYAEAWALPQQNRAEFESLLNKAIAIDPDQNSEGRLVNVLAQERARWLLARIDELAGPASSTSQQGNK